MKSKMRATAPLRNLWQSPKHVGHVAGREDGRQTSHKWWYCKTSEHWTDHSQKFLVLGSSNRFKVVRENNACYSCLKRAGRNHNMATCSRRRQCSEVVNGAQCKHYHNPLLHNANKPAVLGYNKRRDYVAYYSDGNPWITQRQETSECTTAEINLTRTSVAEEHGLKDKTVTITMAKFGGEENEMATKIYRFRIRSLENQSIHTITAVGIPSISNDVSVIKLDNVAEAFGLGKETLVKQKKLVVLLQDSHH